MKLSFADEHSLGPGILKIYEYLWKQTDELAPGTKLPTVRDLMAKFSVSQAVVQAAIKELGKEGLVVSAVGRGTFTKERLNPATKTVAIFRSDYPSRRGDDITRAIQSKLANISCKTLVVTYPDMDSAIQVTKSLPTCDGYILQPDSNHVPASLIAFLQKQSRAVAVFCEEMSGISVDSVGIDLMSSVLLSIQHLVNLGHTQITFVVGEPLFGTDICERFFRHTAQHIGIEKGWEQPCFVGTQPFESAALRTQKWMDELIKSPNRSQFPTAIIARSYATAVGLLKSLHHHNIRVPEDISIVAIDNTDIEIDPRKWLTIAGASSEMIAEAISQKLIWRWSNRGAPNSTTVLNPTLEVMSSTSTKEKSRSKS